MPHGNKPYGRTPPETVCLQGSGAQNEDFFGYNDNWYWVFDGTNLSTSVTCFAMVMAHIGEKNIDIACLSDCAAIIWRRGSCEAEVYTDTRIDKFTKRTKRVLDYARKNGLSGAGGRELALRQIVKNRRSMNKPGGYWVGTADGAGFDQALTWSVDIKNADQVLLCSDGFMRLFEYNIMSMHDFFINGVTLNEAARLLRAFERDIPDFTELKRHDDVTAVRVTV
ncbi:MAG: hypothetical protein FWE91_02385 [Defluviitaleaceae bacterium]|nr:hypothetical protein [Defluviitaleaceae bacterium]MCL2835155.1 hypothetical protein [Defluviitaleaceae bacterium]